MKLEIHSYVQGYEEIQADLKKISEIIKCPLVLVGHLKPQLNKEYFSAKPWLTKLFKVLAYLNSNLQKSCFKISSMHYCEINDAFKKESYKKILKDKVNKVSDLDLNHYERSAYTLIYEHITERGL